MILFKKHLKYYIYFIGIFFIGRLGLFILYFDRFSSVDINYFLTFLYGLEMDTMAISILLLLPMFLLTLIPKAFGNFVNIFLKYYFLVLLGVAIIKEIATYPFVAQYDARPNFLFVEYLQYPKEVFSMIFADYKKELLFAFVVISSFVVWYLKTYKDDFLEAFNIPYFKRLLLFFPLLILLFIGIRSSFGHRPANISDAMISSNRILNEITKNTIYSVSYAIYVNSKSKAKDIAKRYGKIDLNEAIRRVQKRLDIKNADKKYFLTRFEPTNFPQKETKNIVIFLQESLGAQFVAATGGKNPNITPNMNALAKQGILFTNLYSKGTRSIRGIGGTTSGIFSIPGKGVVKRNKSQRDFFTFSQLLKPRGYHTSFIYGG